MKVTYLKLKNPTESQKEYILLDIVEFVDTEIFEEEQYIEYFGENDTDETGVAFSFLPEDQSIKLIESFKRHGVLIESSDITTGVMMGDFENNTVWKDLFRSDKYDHYSQPYEVLKKFLIDNVSKDTILDKINEKGFDKLTDIDLQILNTDK